VPPKGSIELSAVDIENLFQLLTGKPRNAKSLISQNGLKYRTICQTCNSTIGIKYDPYINHFSQSVGIYVKSILRFPSTINIKCKPMAIAKGILAHLLAAKANDDKCIFDNYIRQIIFDDDVSVPEDIYIYYWLYPYDQTIILRDFVKVNLNNPNDLSFSNLIKYFPIAYMITDHINKQGLSELTHYRKLTINEEVDIPIQLNSILDPFWPEQTDENHALVLGQAGVESIFAKKRT